MMKAVKKIVGTNMDEFAKRVVLRARNLVVVDTGNLKRNIKRTVKDGGLVIQTTAGYGAYVELGTSKMAAQPFLAPAVQETVNDLVSRGKLYDD